MISKTQDIQEVEVSEKAKHVCSARIIGGKKTREEIYNDRIYGGLVMQLAWHTAFAEFITLSRIMRR